VNVQPSQAVERVAASFHKNPVKDSLPQKDFSQLRQMPNRLPLMNGMYLKNFTIINPQLHNS